MESQQQSITTEGKARYSAADGDFVKVSVSGASGASGAPSPSSRRMETLRIYKNVFVVSFAFLLLFTAFQSVQNLQSSINSVEGLGLASLSVIYASLVVSCMFLPKVIISRLGCKWTLVIAICGYGSYMLLNFYAHWSTLIPGSVLLGTCGAPLWAAKGTYLNELAQQHAARLGVRADAVITHFFGIFYMTFQSGQIWGNLISSQVLVQDAAGGNVTSRTAQRIIDTCCGARYCGSRQECGVNGTSGNENLERPSDTKIYTLFGIYSACAFTAAVFVAVFLDPLKRSNGKDEGGEGKRGPISLNLVIATLRNLRHPEQLLLIPLTVYSGLEKGYIGADFTNAFVSCSWGIHQVGYVMITFGVCSASCSLLFGRLAQYSGRIPFFIGAAALNLAAAIVMLLWIPSVPDHTYVFFILAGLWGVSDAVWQVLINALYGVLFASNEEAGFSNYRLWQSLGFIVAFAYADFLCVTVKVYVLVGMLALGMALYLYIDTRYTHRGKERRAE